MKMMTIIILIMALVLISSVSAVTVYTYGFEDANEFTNNITAGTGWTQATTYARTGSNGVYSAQTATNNATYNKNIDASAYQNCTLEAYMYREAGVDTGENICFRYSNNGGLTWTGGVSGTYCLEEGETEGAWVYFVHTITVPTSQMRYQFGSAGAPAATENMAGDDIYLNCTATNIYRPDYLFVFNTTDGNGDVPNLGSATCVAEDVQGATVANYGTSVCGSAYNGYCSLTDGTNDMWQLNTSATGAACPIAVDAVETTCGARIRMVQAESAGDFIIGDNDATFIQVKLTNTANFTKSDTGSYPHVETVQWTNNVTNGVYWFGKKQNTSWYGMTQLDWNGTERYISSTGAEYLEGVFSIGDRDSGTKAVKMYIDWLVCYKDTYLTPTQMRQVQDSLDCGNTSMGGCQPPVTGDTCDTTSWNCAENCEVSGLNAGGNMITVTGTGVIRITGAVTNCNTKTKLRISGACSVRDLSNRQFCR